MTLPMIAAFPPDMAAQDGEGIQNHAQGGFFEKVFRDHDLCEIRIRKVTAVGHLVPGAPVHLAPQGGSLLMDAVFGHDGIKTDDFMPGQGQLGHGAAHRRGPGEKIFPRRP